MWFHKNDKSYAKDGLIAALMQVGYISLVATFMSNADKVFGKADKAVTPVVFLTMFSLSVLVSALIVLYKPYMLFMDNKGKEAMQLVVYTAKWLLVSLILLFGLLWIW